MKQKAFIIQSYSNHCVNAYLLPTSTRCPYDPFAPAVLTLTLHYIHAVWTYCNHRFFFLSLHPELAGPGEKLGKLHKIDSS